MIVVSNASRRVYELPGLQHQTLAARIDGLNGLEVWMQTLAAGAQTPVHYHECEEVILVQSGSGRVFLADQRLEFVHGSTLVIPPKVIHQIVNDDSEPMRLVAVLSETPARVFKPDGELMDLPWQSGAI